MYYCVHATMLTRLRNHHPGVWNALSLSCGSCFGRRRNVASQLEKIVLIGCRVVGYHHHWYRSRVIPFDCNRDHSNVWRNNSHHIRRIRVVLANDDRLVFYHDVYSPALGFRRRRIGFDWTRSDSIDRRSSGLVRACS